MTHAVFDPLASFHGFGPCLQAGFDTLPKLLGLPFLARLLIGEIRMYPMFATQRQPTNPCENRQREWSKLDASGSATSKSP